jgi:hypothetical protein
LIKKIISRRRPVEIKTIINFVWNLWKNEHKDISNFNQKVKDILSLAVELLNDGSETSKELFNFTQWLEVFEKVDDEIFKNIDICLKQKSGMFDGHDILKNLVVHLDNSPDKVGGLLLTYFNESKYPPYESKENEGQCQMIVESLFERGYREVAIKICNTAFDKGQPFLMDLLEKYK